MLLATIGVALMPPKYSILHFSGNDTALAEFKVESKDS
jgi:hypothetical protein